MALQLDPNSGLPLDPATVQALQEQNLMREVSAGGGSAADRLTAETVGRGVNTLFPTLAMQQSQQMDAAMKAQNITQQDGESQLDFNIRQLQAQRDTAMKIDPMAAAQMNTQLTKLADMKFQQDRLRAYDQRTQSDFDAKSGDRASEAATGGYGYLVKPKADGSVDLTGAQTFNLTDPAQTQAMTDALRKDPTLKPMSQKDMVGMLKSQDTGERKLAMALLTQQARTAAGMLPEETLGQVWVDNIVQPSLTRLSPQARSQLAGVEIKAGITGAEKAGLIGEYKGMMAAVGNAAKRESNMSMFTNELQQQGDELIRTASQVDRGRIALINKAWSQGQAKWNDSGPEAAYGAALMSYTGTYGRIRGGATGTTSDSARHEAMEALQGGFLGPKGLKGAVDELNLTEGRIVNNASDATVELFTNPDRYRHMISVQEKLKRAGYNIAGVTTTADSGADQRSPPTSTPIDRSRPPPGAAPQQSRVVDFSTLK